MQGESRFSTDSLLADLQFCRAAVFDEKFRVELLTLREGTRSMIFGANPCGIGTLAAFGRDAHAATVVADEAAIARRAAVAAVAASVLTAGAACSACACGASCCVRGGIVIATAGNESEAGDQGERHDAGADDRRNMCEEFHRLYLSDGVRNLKFERSAVDEATSSHAL